MLGTRAGRRVKAQAQQENPQAKIPVLHPSHTRSQQKQWEPVAKASQGIPRHPKASHVSTPKSAHLWASNLLVLLLLRRLLWSRCLAQSLAAMMILTPSMCQPLLVLTCFNNTKRALVLEPPLLVASIFCRLPPLSSAQSAGLQWTGRCAAGEWCGVSETKAWCKDFFAWLLQVHYACTSVYYSNENDWMDWDGGATESLCQRNQSRPISGSGESTQFVRTPETEDLPLLLASPLSSSSNSLSKPRSAK